MEMYDEMLVVTFVITSVVKFTFFAEPVFDLQPVITTVSQQAITILLLLECFLSIYL